MSMKVTVKGNVNKVFKDLLKEFPTIQAGLLHHIGYRGRRALYENYLRGQVIMLRQYPYGKDQRRRTVNYSLAKDLQSVKVSSYPLNLYRPRQVYNSASSVVLSEVEASLSIYDKNVLQKRLKQIDKAAKK